ncbi:ester cyclase [Kineococcus aurantiacus]|uniref:Putative ester cyclase n=1 Tax=Kineococcus aurantiacus TaxID=37633 RepID=A0A7Y9DM28_9ACTN|nr:putative ester cyclase [Kineococcus aurantiacus]
MNREELLGVYRGYLACCNERRFDELGRFVSERVSGSAPVDGLAAYVEGVRAVITAFPDYRWEPLTLVVDGDTLAVRLTGRGTHRGPFGGLAPTGRRVEVQELVVYRFEDGLVVNCWGDLYPVLREALRAPAAASG